MALIETPRIRILVVEDENIVAVDIQDRLEYLGYEVPALVASGEEAIVMAEEIRPDLVLMDIMLKGAIDGVMAAEQIYALDIPVVYLTAYSDIEMLERAKITEPYGYLLKPLDERELQISIEVALYKHKTQKKLKESERRLSTLLESMGEAVIATDESGLVTFTNSLAEAITGQERNESIGRPLSDVFVLVDGETGKPVDEPVSGIMDEATTISGRHMLVQKNETWIPVEYTATPMFDDKELFSGIVVVFSDISGRMKAERELKLAKEKAELIYKVSPSAIFTVDRDLRITSWNDRAREITGYSEEEIIGRKCTVFSEEPCSDGCPLFADEIEKPVTSASCFIRRKDGQDRVVSKNVDFLRDAEGNVIGGIESFEDITERRRTEATLQDSEMRFRSVVQSANDAIIQSDGEGRIIAWNKGAQDIFGYGFDEVQGRPVTVLMPDVYRDAHTKGLERVRDGGESHIIGGTVELEGLRKDGSRFPIELSIATWSTEEGIFFSSIIRDVTERKQADEYLEETLSELNIILDNASVGIVFLKEGRLLRINRKLEEMFGYERKEIEGESMVVFCISPKDWEQMQKDAHEILAQGKPYQSERRMKHRNGQLFWCSLFGKAIEHTDPSKGSIWIMDDITERKRVRMELQEAKEAAETASRTKSEFLANVSHEIRTPLNGVIGMTELAMDTELTDEQREYLEAVRQSADSLLGLINDILDFSKIEASRMELEKTDFNLFGVIGEAVELFTAQAQLKGIVIHYNVVPDVPQELRGDPVRLRQVLVNLLANAVKFTDEGEIVVNVERVDVSGLSNGEGSIMLHFSVSDTGIGIAPEKLETVFDSFTQADGSTTREYGGTGLGLSISRQIVSMMGGEIWTESEIGKGSRFHFTVNLARREEALGESLSREYDFISDLNVLVVEGDTNKTSHIRDIMVSFGAASVRQEGVEDAMEVLEKAYSDARPFGLVLIDHDLTRTEGLALVGKIKGDRRLSETRLILLAHSVEKKDAFRIKAPGIACMVGPVRKSALLNKILSVFGFSGGVPKRARLSGARVEGPRGLNILVAEDNPVNQKLVTRILEKYGHHPVIVVNGREAVDVVKERRFDLVLMDVQMPDMDGLEATRIIRGSNTDDGFSPMIPIIAMTAHAIEGDRERFLGAGMTDYISKPFKLDDFIDIINKTSLAGTAGASGMEEDIDILDIDSALERLDGDESLLREIWNAFAEDIPVQMAELESALDGRESAEVERLAHSMKSASGSVGAIMLSKVAYKMEKASREKDMEGAKALYGMLKYELDRAMKAFEQFSGNSI
jgi:PAS domain S-box-containing protein